MITFEEIAATLSEAQQTKLGNRLAKAIALAANHTTIYPGQEPNTYSVRSQTHHDGWYTVNTTTKTCSCKDSQRGNPCKHRTAVWLRQAYNAAVYSSTHSTAQSLIAAGIVDENFRIFATHTPTGQRAEIIEYFKTGPNNDVFITARLANNQEIHNAPRSDFTNLFLSS